MPVQLEYGRSESKNRIGRRAIVAVLAAILCFAIIGVAWFVAIKTLRKSYVLMPLNDFLIALRNGKVDAIGVQGNDVWGEFTQPQPTPWGSTTTLKFFAGFPGPSHNAQTFIQSYGGYPHSQYHHPLRTLDLWVVSSSFAGVLIGDALLSLTLGIWLFARWQRRAASRAAG